jgi:3-methylcrotonyl-CoA carboxylase alpha subunit
LKLSVWGEDRIQAIDRLAASLDELRILGVQSNQALFRAICTEKDFRAGMYGTPYLDLHRAALQAGSEAQFAEFMKRVGPALLNQSVRGATTAAAAAESLWSWNARRAGLEGGV